MLAQRARDTAANLGQWVERLVHAHRRRKARRQLTEQQVHSLLFLCQGNAYRSPYAAAVFKCALTAMQSTASLNVASAGFIAPGHSSPERAVSVARTRGIDLSSHLSALVTPQSVIAADLVVVMSEDQAQRIRFSYGHNVRVLILGDLDPLPIESRTITDPWGCDVEIVDQVYSRIDRCVVQLAKLIAYADSGRPS